MANQKIMDRKNKTVKYWEFHQGHMDLKFDINVDVKTDVADFLECLKQAVKDLEEELKGSE